MKPGANFLIWMHPMTIVFVLMWLDSHLQYRCSMNTFLFSSSLLSTTGYMTASSCVNRISSPPTFHHIFSSASTRSVYLMLLWKHRVETLGINAIRSGNTNELLKLDTLSLRNNNQSLRAGNNMQCSFIIISYTIEICQHSQPIST